MISSCSTVNGLVIKQSGGVQRRVVWKTWRTGGIGGANALFVNSLMDVKGLISTRFDQAFVFLIC